MPKAYSYLRFSTPEQARGDSFRRQAQLAREFAAKHGLELDEQLTFQDLGVSAYRGSNAESGRLGDFLEAVRAGQVPPQSYLLVESLDRVSRQTARKALRLLEDIIETDVLVVTLTDGRIYDRETLDKDPTALMMALVIFMRAHDESAMKSRRLKAVWQSKRSKADAKALTARAPSWLRLTPLRTWEVVEERAAVVRRVFAMAAQGIGQHAITTALNADGVPPFGRGKGFWHRSAVAKLLANPAVAGTFVPHTLEHEGNKRLRQPQKPVEGYFPRIVEEGLYEAVRALWAGQRSPQRGRHTHEPVRNALGGLAQCPLCGGRMTRVSKGSKARAGKPSLVCVAGKTGAGCKYHAVPYEAVEAALIASAGHLIALAPSGGGNAPSEELERTLAQIAAHEEAKDNLLRALEQGRPSGAIRERLAAVEADLVELRSREANLWEEASRTRGALVEARLERLLDALIAEPFDAAAANAAMRAVLTAVVVDYRSGHLRFLWSHGGESETVYAWPSED
jgi:DNA invertase Pin-like site-specific DNA recombinase